MIFDCRCIMPSSHVLALEQVLKAMLDVLGRKAVAKLTRGRPFYDDRFFGNLASEAVRRLLHSAVEIKLPRAHY